MYPKIVAGLLLVLLLGCSATPALGQDGGRRSVEGNGAFRATDSTNIDFSETMIDGKMQAPSGFFLQGRNSQTMTQMVKLRSKWRSELRNSKAAVKSLVK